MKVIHLNALSNFMCLHLQHLAQCWPVNVRLAQAKLARCGCEAKLATYT